MNSPIIGIAANYKMDAGEELYHLPISYTPHGYIAAVQRAGGLPFILPISQKATAASYIQRIDKLILAGGQDVLPQYYGEQAAINGSYLKERDEFELALIEEALQQNKPIFAVCRGMQLLNVYFGGTLNQELGKMTDVLHMQAPKSYHEQVHDLVTDKNSWIQKIIGPKTRVNSFHNQSLAMIADNFKKTAWASDGTIEAIEDPIRNILAVQWHPDFSYDVSEKEQAIFDFVVKKL